MSSPTDIPPTDDDLTPAVSGLNPARSGGPHRDLSTAIYMQCAGLHRFHRQDLTADGASPDEIDDAMQELAARGLITQLFDGSWVTNPPDQSLAERAGRLEQHAATIRAAAPGLARLYYEARARAHDGHREVGVELLDNLDDVNAAMSELFAGAHRNVYSMRTRSPRVLQMTGDPDRAAATVRNSAGDTLHLQVTFDTSLLGDKGLPEAIARRMRQDDIRFATNVPFTATASDTGVTVMDLQSESSGSVGVRITHPGVSGAIRTVIQNNWVHGMKWSGLGSVAASRPGPLDQRDREILGLLVGGAADATIARQVGVSQRTVERRVRRILELLQATTRFQAGVLAAQRGWI